MTHRAPIVAGLLLALSCNCTSSAPGAPTPVRSADDVPASAPIVADDDHPLPPLPPPDPREAVIAAGVRELLQSEHLNARPIDDAVSKKAAKRLVELLDPGKFFLLQWQVDTLMRHATELDDELASGDLTLGRLGVAMLVEQRQKVGKMVDELLAEPFDLERDESLQTDPEKRGHAKTDDELKELWRRNLKLQVLERMERMREALKDQEERAAKAEAKPEKSKGAKKKDAGTGDAGADELRARKEPLPTTDPEREAKARADLATTYAGRFKRLATSAPLEPVEYFVNAIAGVFDPHTQYLAPDEQANFDIQMSGSLEGIGAVLSEDDHYIEIREIVPGGAAWRQGDLEAGDLILAVKQAEGEPVDVADMRLSEVVNLIRGPKGTVVTLTVRKPDERELVVAITRDVIVVEASYARGAVLDLGDGYDPVGYVYLPSFYGNTRATKGRTPDRNAVDDVRALLQLFAKKKVSGVLLDLRGNGGGLLSAAKDITGLFIPKGPVVQAGTPRRGMQVLRDDDPAVYFDGPVVAMVDRFSASASEILAGALQDYGRAVIVGTGPTHGKGTVQTLVDLDRAAQHRGKPLGVFKLTIQQYFLVDGDSTQLRGVQPDLVLPDPASFVESGERELDNAIPWSSVDPVRHTPWSGGSFDRKALAANSNARRPSEPVFATIESRGKLLESRRDDTVVPLKLEAWRARRETDEKELEALDPKLDEQPAQFSVKVVKYGNEKPPPPRGTAAAGTDDRLEKWQQALSRDPWIAESLHVLADMAGGK